MVQVQFIYGQEDRMSVVYGPYEYIEMTYNALCVGKDGERELAYLSDRGIWVSDDGQTWSDFCITSC